MEQTEFLRQFQDLVVLGLPREPLAFLLGLRRAGNKRPHLFLARCPLWLRLIPLAKVHLSAANRWQEILLLELSTFADRHSDKVLTLLPGAPEAHGFVNRNRHILESRFIIKTDTASGGKQ